MRIIVILAPTNRRGTKTEYTQLRNFLNKDGYLPIIPDVYMRITQNRKTAEKHFRRIRDYAPKTGTVRILRLTEKQFQSIELLIGEEDEQEKLVGTNSIVML